MLLKVFGWINHVNNERNHIQMYAQMKKNLNKFEGK